LRKYEVIFRLMFLSVMLFFISCAARRKAYPAPPPPPPSAAVAADSNEVSKPVGSGGPQGNENIQASPPPPPLVSPPSSPLHKYQSSKPAALPSASPGEPSSTTSNRNPTQAAISYSFKNKVPKGGSILIHLLVQLDKPPKVVEGALRGILDDHPAIEKDRTDTSIIKTRLVSGDKYFVVTLNTDKEFFKVDSLSKGVQELNTQGSTIWKWRVYGIKETTNSEVSLTIESIDEAGKLHHVDDGVLSMEVTVESSSKSSVVPGVQSKFVTDKKSFWQKSKWIFMAGGAGLLALFALLFIKKRRAGARKIYFSYAWNSEEDLIVDKLYNSLTRSGFNAVRDKSNLKYKGKISNFMSDIGKADFVLVFISDKYLKSKFCMFELYEIYRNSRMNKDEFMKKLFPVRMEEIRLDSPDVVSSYIEYWENEEVKWNTLIKQNSDSVTAEQSNQYQVLKRIVTDLGTLLYLLSDINALQKDQLFANDFAEIKSAITNAT
jgi:NAD(P)H-flavin reductase